MAGIEGSLIALGGSIIEMFAACVVAFHAAMALASIMHDRSGDRARVLIAEGVLAALGFSLAGTLLKTIGLQSWMEIRSFAFIWVLRTILKRVFRWEREMVLRRRATAAPE